VVASVDELDGEEGSWAFSEGGKEATTPESLCGRSCGLFLRECEGGL